ncbi:MAG: glycosyltransferase family 4 protein [Pseudomonadota bacterium]
MRIAHLETGRHLYGGAQQVLQLADALQKAGHQNVIYAVPDSEIIAPAVMRGHEVLPTRVAGDHDISLIWRLRGQLLQDKPDLLHVHSRRGADTFGGIAARLAGIPAVLSRRVDNPISRLGVKFRYWPYRRVIAISQAIQAILLAAGQEQVTLIPDAIETGDLVLSPELSWFGKEFSLLPGAPVVGVIAQLIERKGHAQLLEALPLVLGETPDLKVIFFGRGPLEQELRAKVAEQGLSQVVHFAGFRTDLARCIPCLDLVAHPALAEGMGVAVLEAGAAAVPVVAFAVGGVREAIDHGQTGLLVEPGDTLGFADALRRLLADRDYAAALGVAARRRMIEHFSMDIQLQQHVALYAAVLQEVGHEHST